MEVVVVSRRVVAGRDAGGSGEGGEGREEEEGDAEKDEVVDEHEQAKERGLGLCSLPRPALLLQNNVHFSPSAITGSGLVTVPFPDLRRPAWRPRQSTTPTRSLSSTERLYRPFTQSSDVHGRYLNIACRND